MIRLPKLIGITGKAGVGKDTLADSLVELNGFAKYSMASPIKSVLNERYGWSDVDWLDRYWKERPNVRAGADGMGSYFSPRQVAQWYGTEAGRMVHGEDCWVKVAERTIQNTLFPLPVVIPDIRFQNEADMVCRLGGVLVRVLRSGVPAVASHSSEDQDFETDVVVSNIGGKEHFAAHAKARISSWFLYLI